jgi:antitoxin component of MazEF toxin-antitoxin module
MRVQEVKRRFSVGLPRDIVAQAGLKKGDSVTVNFNERGNIELKAVKSRVDRA